MRREIEREDLNDSTGTDEHSNEFLQWIFSFSGTLSMYKWILTLAINLQSKCIDQKEEKND